MTKRRPRAGYVLLFLAMAAAAILALQFGQGFFPGDRAGAFLGRQLCSAFAFALLMVGSSWLLARDGPEPNPLGLKPGWIAARAFLLGLLFAVAHILLLFAILYAMTPFELGRGPATATSVALASVGYLTGNAGEELLFRGYLLVVLARWLGPTPAIWIMALPFGLFHFQGLDALGLAKMMLTTGAMHFVYTYVFLATRSLWASIAMHALGNTLLHELLGVDRPGFLAVQFTRELPTAVDGTFVVFFGVTAAVAIGLSRLGATRRGAAWLTGNPRPG